MVYVVPKMPKGIQVTSAEYKDESIYLAQVPNGLIVDFRAFNEVVFATYDELIAYMATAKREVPPEPEETKKEPEKKPGVREIPTKR